jgi:hypothetical protein
MDVWGDSRGKTPGGPLCSSSCILFGDTRREVTGLEFFRGEYLFMLYRPDNRIVAGSIGKDRQGDQAGAWAKRRQIRWKMLSFTSFRWMIRFCLPALCFG